MFLFQFQLSDYCIRQLWHGYREQSLKDLHRRKKFAAFKQTEMNDLYENFNVSLINT